MMLDSFTPRLVTMLILIGARPAPCAASIPARTFATGKSTSFIARKVASSSESRLTVIRLRPAAARAFAFCASREPFVVSVRSRSPRAASFSTSRSRSRRTSGSPPVSRIFCTPRPTKIRTRRSISSKVRISARGRNWKSLPKISFGMQYTQRKLQRSVTLTRRSWSGRPSVSSGSTGKSMRPPVLDRRPPVVRSLVSGALDVDLCERLGFHLREIVRVPERANDGQLEDELTVGKLRARSGRADESVPGEGEDARACAVAWQVVERHRLALRRSGRDVKGRECGPAGLEVKVKQVVRNVGEGRVAKAARIRLLGHREPVAGNSIERRRDRAHAVHPTGLPRRDLRAGEDSDRLVVTDESRVRDPVDLGRAFVARDPDVPAVDAMVGAGRRVNGHVHRGRLIVFDRHGRGVE